MSDKIFVAATITIGGNLTEAARTDLALAIQEDQVALFEHGPRINPLHKIDRAIDQALTAAEPLVLFGPEEEYGRFSCLEDFCRRHKLHFRRVSDPAKEYDAEVEYFDGQQSHQEFANALGDVTIAGHEIEAAMRDGTMDAVVMRIRAVTRDVPRLRLLSSSRELLAEQETT